MAAKDLQLPGLAADVEVPADMTLGYADGSGCNCWIAATAQSILGVQEIIWDNHLHGMLLYTSKMFKFQKIWFELHKNKIM